MIKGIIIAIISAWMFAMPAALIAIIVDTIKDSEADFDVD